MSYHDSPNKAKYLSDVIHRMIASDQEDRKAQEPLNRDDAPQVSTDAEKRLEAILVRLEQLSKDLYGSSHEFEWVEYTVDDIIRQGRGDIAESS